MTFKKQVFAIITIVGWQNRNQRVYSNIVVGLDFPGDGFGRCVGSKTIARLLDAPGYSLPQVSSQDTRPAPLPGSGEDVWTSY